MPRPRHLLPSPANTGHFFCFFSRLSEMLFKFPNTALSLFVIFNKKPSLSSSLTRSFLSLTHTHNLCPILDSCKNVIMLS